jgi:superfamily II DNA/RNA helicase
MANPCPSHNPADQYPTFLNQACKVAVCQQALCFSLYPVQTVRFLHETLAKEGYRTVMLHGMRTQHEREEAMKDFRSGKAQVCKFCLCNSLHRT